MRTTMGCFLERKEAVLKKMLPPNNQSVAGLAKEEGISDANLNNWRQQARNGERLMPDSDSTPEGWKFTGKFAAVMESATMSEAEIVEYCRQRDLYQEQLASWRAACEQAKDWHRAPEKQLTVVTRADRKKRHRQNDQLS